RGSIAGCDLLTLEDPTHAKVEMDVDPEPHLIGVYAVFAPGDSVLLAGVTFGIHFPETVSIIASGACSNNGVLIVPPDWPSDRQGVASAVLPPQTSSVVPIYWFYILANEPGFFELTPHPVPRHGGAFGSGDPAPRLTPITGYGRLGIGSRGKLPQAGVYASRGICCLDKCQWLSPLECDWFTGLWLGSDTDCSSDPCDPDGLAGACCIGDDCELRTRIDCITAGGRFFGEGKSCEEIDCLEEIGGR
ncbi:MAG: hypothetical protein R3E12_20300, partial [Candidatus Eisenbacteria bacterium]